MCIKYIHRFRYERTVKDHPLFSDWIDHVFDHPVENPAWHWSLDAPLWNGSAVDTVACIADTFESSGELVARFSDEQLNQGFWYLVSNSCSDIIYSLIDTEVPLNARLRAIWSFVPLFEQVMADRCSPHLSHLDEKGVSPLNSACYMWWDLLPICGSPEHADRLVFDAEVLKVLARLLAIPHDACRESALHGISEWHFYYPSVEKIVDKWLDSTRDLRPELVRYARAAKVGNVL